MYNSFFLFADTFFAMGPLEEQVYRATFKVVEGDTFSPELADPSTERFKVTSRDYRERLNLLFRRSRITHGFAGTEVLALDGLVLLLEYLISKTILISILS